MGGGCGIFPYIRLLHFSHIFGMFAVLATSVTPCYPL